MFHDLREVEEEGVFVAAGVGLEADWEAARGATGGDGNDGVAGEVGGMVSAPAL